MAWLPNFDWTCWVSAWTPAVLGAPVVGGVDCTRRARWRYSASGRLRAPRSKAVGGTGDARAIARNGGLECEESAGAVRIARSRALADEIRGVYETSGVSIRAGSRRPAARGIGAPAPPAHGRSHSVGAADFLALDTPGSENSDSPC